MEFRRNVTPLDLSAIKDIVQEFVQTLPPELRKQIEFRDDRQERITKGYVSCWSDAKVQSAATLEQIRAESMSPVNIAAHFARFKAFLNKHNVREP